MRLIVHAGFHKTGTTSVQTALDDNAATLAPHLRVFRRSDFEPLVQACQAASLSDATEDLDAVRAHAKAFAATFDPADMRPVLMTSEDIAGLIPGRRGVTAYGVAPDILRALVQGMVAGRPGTAPHVFLSVRAPERWLRAVWWQNLRSTRTTDDFAATSAALSAGADLQRAARRVRAALAPVPVTVAALEDSADLPFGPLTPLLDLADLPDAVRATLAPPTHANATPEMGLPEVFLALNRSALGDKPVREAKKLLRRAATRQLQAEGARHG